MKTNIKKEDIKGIRKLTELSQTQFAEYVGVSVDTIRKWEQGKANPSPLAWEKLQKVVNNLKRSS